MSLEIIKNVPLQEKQFSVLKIKFVRAELRKGGTNQVALNI